MPTCTWPSSTTWKSFPVINKIDLPSADIEGVKKQITHDLGLDSDGALLVSGKLGTGVDELCEAIVERVPPPKGSAEEPLKALIFDSHYDVYRGVIVHVRVYEGRLQAGQTVRFWWNSSTYKVEETGHIPPRASCRCSRWARERSGTSLRASRPLRTRG